MASEKVLSPNMSDLQVKPGTERIRTMVMSDFDLKVLKSNNDSTERLVTCVLKQGNEEVYSRDAQVFSEDDIIRVCNEVTEVSGLSMTDVEQWMASLMQPIRTQWLRKQDQQRDGRGAQEHALVAAPRYVAVLPEANDPGKEACIRDMQSNRAVCNFVLVLDEDIEVQDDVESRREFAGRLTAFGRTTAFRITAEDYADNGKLRAALFNAGGCELVIHCRMDELRKAVSIISRQNGRVQQRKVTTNFGWAKDRSAYLTPSTRITASRVESVDEKADIRVDLDGETPACHLDMKKLGGDELVRVKRHIVDDLLQLNDCTVTYPLLGAVAAAVLYPYAEGAGRFALWLVGRTGSGKSFAAKHFMNFFGDFPISSGCFTTWSATPNFVQRQGYFFKDSLYLVDDYKPEVVQQHQVVRVLQTYADSTARGRLKADATANVLRPIRGLLVCTGEDVPEHNASAVARSVIVQVTQQTKNVSAGNRCVEECGNYSAVMADFIRWLIAGKRTEIFARRFRELQQQYLADVNGQQNDIRVATNLAQLGAAFEQIAEYLGDVWSNWREAAIFFIEKNLMAIRASMLGEAKEQQASEVFLRTLADLIQYGHVRIEGLTGPREAENKLLVGRVVRDHFVPGVSVAASNQDRLEICTSLAMAQVNNSLRQQGRPELSITERALLQQLREDGKLLDRNGDVLQADADPSRRVRFGGGTQVRAFTISRRELDNGSA
jgi:hypothetical protein